MSPERICIIGAGASGIAAAKVLHQRGLPFDCFEKGSGIGGLWRYENDNGLSAIYRSLHINTSRDRMGYADFPMPRHYPEFPHHSQVLAYFEAYVDHFGFRDRITFQTEVVQVAPDGAGAYHVQIRLPTGEVETRSYRAVLVANGHHWAPWQPTLPGSFDGLQLHAHDYRTPEALADRNVLIVGIGNTACDIACEVWRVARKTWMSTRRSAHIIPKYVLGRPLDAWSSPLPSMLPLWFRRAFFNLLLRLTRGRQRTYGFPEPRHKLFAEHPTISSELLNHVGHGRIGIRPEVERLLGDRVRFVDGTEEAVDVIVYATGYDIRFPFFDLAFVAVRDNHLPLYRHVVPPRLPNLFFIGLVQPLGAIMPLAELQSEWVADLLEGTCALPTVTRMEQALAQEQAAMQRRYLASRRHTMQVDYWPYVFALRRERRRGRRTTAPAG